MSPLRLDSPVLEIDPRLANRRIGAKTKGAPAHEVLAESLGIVTVGQLLRHYPRRYIDRSATVDIGQLRLGQEATVIGNVASVSSRRTRRGQSMVTVRVYDGTGFVELLYFNQPWMGTRYRQGSELAVSGQVKSRRGGTVQLGAFEVEELSGDDADQVHTGRITPVHPATEGVSTKTIRELVFRALERLPRIPEPIPPDIVEAEHLASEDEALRGIHFPEDEAARRRAVDRLKFDELFSVELGVAGCLPQAAGRIEPDRGGSPGRGRPHQAFPGGASVRADRRAAAGRQGGRGGHGRAPADEPPSPG